MFHEPVIPNCLQMIRIFLRERAEWKIVWCSSSAAPAWLYLFCYFFIGVFFASRHLSADSSAFLSFVYFSLILVSPKRDKWYRLLVIHNFEWIFVFQIAVLQVINHTEVPVIVKYGSLLLWCLGLFLIQILKLHLTAIKVEFILKCSRKSLFTFLTFNHPLVLLARS